MINLLEILQRKEKATGRTGMVDYSRFSFCARCQCKKDKELTFCDYCGRKLRHRPLTKHAKYWDRELKYIE